MDKKKKPEKSTSKSQIEKENQDIDTLPSSEEVISNTQPAKSEVQKSSQLNKSGKTENSK